MFNCSRVYFGDYVFTITYHLTQFDKSWKVFYKFLMNKILMFRYFLMLEKRNLVSDFSAINPTRFLGKLLWRYFAPTSIDFFKFNNGNIRAMCEICFKLTKKAPEWCRSCAFIFWFEQISHNVLEFPLLSFNE